MEQIKVDAKNLPPAEILIKNPEKLPQHATDLSSVADQGELLSVVNLFLRVSMQMHLAAGFQALWLMACCQNTLILPCARPPAGAHWL